MESRRVKASIYDFGSIDYGCRLQVALARNRVPSVAGRSPAVAGTARFAMFDAAGVVVVHVGRVDVAAPRAVQSIAQSSGVGSQSLAVFCQFSLLPM